MANKFILDKVLESIADTREYIEKKRKESTEEVYDRFRTPRKKYWIFGPLVTPTEEDVINRAENLMDSSYDLRYAKERYSNWLYQLEKIEYVALALKDRCFTDINLSVDEFENVAAFYKVDD